MSRKSNQVTVTLSQELAALVRTKTVWFGISMSEYFRILALNDVQDSAYSNNEEKHCGTAGS